MDRIDKILTEQLYDVDRALLMINNNLSEQPLAYRNYLIALINKISRSILPKNYVVSQDGNKADIVKQLKEEQGEIICAMVEHLVEQIPDSVWH